MKKDVQVNTLLTLPKSMINILDARGEIFFFRPLFFFFPCGYTVVLQLFSFPLFMLGVIALQPPCRWTHKCFLSVWHFNFQFMSFIKRVYFWIICGSGGGRLNKKHLSFHLKWRRQLEIKMKDSLSLEEKIANGQHWLSSWWKKKRGKIKFWKLRPWFRKVFNLLNFYWGQPSQRAWFSVLLHLCVSRTH